MIVGHVDHDGARSGSIRANEGCVIENQIESSVVIKVRPECYCPIGDCTCLVNSVGGVAEWIFSLVQSAVILRH